MAKTGYVDHRHAVCEMVGLSGRKCGCRSVSSKLPSKGDPRFPGQLGQRELCRKEERLGGVWVTATARHETARAS